MEKYRKNIVKLIFDEWDDLRRDEMLVEFIHEHTNSQTKLYLEQI